MKREGLLWGTLIVLCASALVVAAWDWIGQGGTEPPPEPMRLGENDAIDAGAEPRFVPRLPPVPMLVKGIRFRPGDAPADDALGSEMRLLREASGLMSADPPDAPAALLLLDQHRESFPQGALREEREAMAIEAMLAMGERSRAERRYIDFRQDFPSSTALPRLERAMQ